jgi:hypothetical protein
MLSIHQSVLDVKGIAGVMEFIEFLMMSVVLTFFLYYGVNHMKRFRDKGLFDTERKMSLGFSLFFISLFVGYGSYYVDRVVRFFLGKPGFEGRIFLTDVDYGITSVINRDYMLFTFIEMGFCLVFLSYVVEKYLLSRRVVLMWICAAILAYTGALRFLEIALYHAFPEVVRNIGWIAYGGLLVVFILLLVLFGKIITIAPKRSSLWKSSVTFVIGFVIMVAMLLAGNNFFLKGDAFPGENAVGPVITLASVFLLNSGLTNAYKSLVDYFQSEHVCIVHRGKIAGKMFICPRCGVFYCIPCRDAIAEIDGKCWNCKTALEQGKTAEQAAAVPAPQGMEARPETGGTPEIAAGALDKEPGKVPKKGVVAGEGLSKSAKKSE